MDLTDHDFHLFTEAGGVDSVLYRTGSGEFRLAQVHPRPGKIHSGAPSFTTSIAAAPVSTVDGAIERLELTGQPFVFFQDRDLRRGCVLSHR